MRLIEPVDYPAIVPLFRGMAHHLAAVAALDGSVPAEVYADDSAAPYVALVSVNYRRLYLAARGPVANLRDGIRAVLVEAIYPQARAAGADAFSLAYTPAAWGAALDGGLPPGQASGRPPIHTLRHSYELRTLSLVQHRSLPLGFTLRHADRGLLADERVAGLAALREEMCSERTSVEDFLAHSFGLCPVHEDGALAGWCLSEYNTGDRCEVGIASLPPYQRLGLATAMGMAFVDLAAARGVARIGWHCHAGNAASIATARRIGFEKTDEYEAIIAWY